MSSHRRKKDGGCVASRPQKRREEDQKAIDTAKAILMERNRMTEPEAHKYLQKCSMDSQVSLIEAAQMVISLYKMA